MPGEAEWWEGEPIAQRFHDAHRTAYGHGEFEAPIELVNLRLTGLGRLERPMPEAEDLEPRRQNQRRRCL